MVRVLDACPACGARAAKVVAELDDERRKRFLLYSQLKYSGLLTGWLSEIQPVVTRCEGCGHCWYKEQPDDHQLSQMYASGNRLRPEIPMTRDPSDRMLLEMKRLRSLTTQHTPKFLDYGSGFGRWARAAVQAGFEVYAFEPSQARGAEEDMPFTLVHELNSLRGKVFDVVNLEQVLEHVPNPLEVLNGIKAFCHMDTFVRITVPNILRCDEGANIWREWPFDVQRVHTMAPFEHLHGFTPGSLRSVVRRAGFEPVGMMRLASRYPGLAVRYWLGRWIPSLDNTFLIVRQFQV